MKKIVLFLILVAVLVCCNVRRYDKVADGTDKTAMILKDSTTVQLIDSVYNFGTATEGEKVTYNFRFKNSGKKPLIITNTSASCGCTVPEKPDKPVMPGEVAFIKVVFNSRGKVGHNEKTITVSSNAYPEFPSLLLKGDITAAK